MDLIKKFEKKLEKIDRKKGWFIKNYMKKSTKSYFTIMNQLNRNSTLQPETEDAIKTFLED